MSCILHIETSTKVCSVALSENGSLIFHKEDLEGPNHAVVCGVFVDEALSFANSHAIPVDAVAVSEGPGSYTGLRIGVSLAKGVCYGRDLPLLAVPTLKLLCVPVLLGASPDPSKGGGNGEADGRFSPLLEGSGEAEPLLVPMIDARRMEVYSAVYDRALREVRPVGADIVEPDTYLPYLEEHPVWFFGNGAAKCRDVIQHPNAHFIDGIQPLAKWMFPLAERALHLGEKQDLAYFEPFYLKEYVAGTPHSPLSKIENMS
ncbi:MAG: tRNA (adenosine(37)-N6)-threonylcarbamoyltransferase complex dimerization subunit type 1 TsaB [Bacteroidaceae bacterium]|nr:tRNA (adenosine(37)-N6)-threonylcarbamoyltransferase complex dimerization subunit type 1 TsaB [Bacteroidaceae bacterium]